MKVPPSSLAPILRSDNQGKVLALLYGHPDRSFSLSEVVRLVDSSMPTVSRELDRAEAAGIVSSDRHGNMRLVRIRGEHPLYEELRRVVLATYGPPVVVNEEFAGIDGVEALILFGSWAARYAGEPGPEPNDLDVLVIGTVDRDQIDEAAQRAERRIGIPVQATVRTAAQWSATEPEGFVGHVKSRPIVVVRAEGVVETHGGRS